MNRRWDNWSANSGNIQALVDGGVFEPRKYLHGVGADICNHPRIINDNKAVGNDGNAGVPHDAVNIDLPQPADGGVHQLQVTVGRPDIGGWVACLTKQINQQSALLYRQTLSFQIGSQAGND